MSYDQTAADLLAENRRLSEANAALRKDAERLRWCVVHKTFPKVTQSVTSSSLDFWSVVVEKNGHRVRVDASTPEGAIDAAIDSAMGTRPGEKG